MKDIKKPETGLSYDESFYLSNQTPINSKLESGALKKILDKQSQDSYRAEK